jgi:hypothetical protein
MLAEIAADTDGAPSVEEIGWVEGAVLYRAVAGAGGVHYERFVVVRVTPKGAWVKADPGQAWRFRSSLEGEKWTGRDGRYCSPNKERALQRLKARARSHARHCRRRLRQANDRLEVLGLPVLPFAQSGDDWAEHMFPAPHSPESSPEPSEASQDPQRAGEGSTAHAAAKGER